MIHFREDNTAGFSILDLMVLNFVREILEQKYSDELYENPSFSAHLNERILDAWSSDESKNTLEQILARV